MNGSGKSVAAVCHFYKIEPENILVAYDEIDFDVGVTRLKYGGGHGGHNGMRDIISALGGKHVDFLSTDASAWATPETSPWSQTMCSATLRSSEADADHERHRRLHSRHARRR